MGVTDNTPEHSGSGADPERLLAEALRAQAGAPGEHGQDAGVDSVGGTAGASEEAEPPADAGPPPGFGLLSGAADGSLERERAALDAVGSSGPRRVSPASRPDRSRSQLPARWILLLAVLLGLAAGSLIGLLTLL